MSAAIHRLAVCLIELRKIHKSACHLGKHHRKGQLEVTPYADINHYEPLSERSTHHQSKSISIRQNIYIACSA